MKFPDALAEAVKNHPYPLVFATVSGAHLYGFPSPDSDWDLRGSHLLPLAQVVGLGEPNETIESMRKDADIELDLVTHDVKKFFTLMLRNNGYVLEQLYSPLVVHATPEHEELKAIGHTCITRYHSRHYLGFANTQWNLFQKEDPPRVKPLLYVYRVLLTGINLMETHRIEANLVILNEKYRLPYIAELIERKVSSKEKQTMAAADMEFHNNEFERLIAQLKESAETTSLPDAASGRAALDDLLKRLRMRQSPA